MDCIGYDGNDMMNHSAAYFAAKMGEYMNDRPDAKEYAAYILELIGMEHQQANHKYITKKAESFTPLQEYAVDMYCKKYLKPGMSSQEAEKVFSDFSVEMTWNIETLTAEYEEIDASIFRPEFEKCCKALGIDL